MQQRRNTMLVGLAVLALTAAAPSPPASAAQAPAAISAAPMHTSGPRPVYPRLTAFPNSAILAKVNAALAKQELDDRDSRSDCIKSVLEGQNKPDADTYQTDIKVSYLSLHYLSLNVVTSYDCGGPYPTNGAETPLTFDLATGETIDWKTLFKPGFLPSDDGEAGGQASSLAKLYKARYRKARRADDECRSVIADPSWSFSPILWLDAARGLVVEPDFPHAVAACADDLGLSPADLAPYVRDAALLADLRSTVKPSRAAASKPSRAEGR